MTKPEDKKNFAPPGWLVTRWDIALDEPQARRLEALRCKLVAEHGAEDPRCDPKALWNRALDLLFEAEGVGS